MRTIVLGLLFCTLGVFAGGSQGAEMPALIQMDAERMAQARRRIQAQDPALQPAYQALVQAATRALPTPPTSVMDKTKTPPSGDKHDYFSIGPYFWPNPKTPDGLPYISRDGQTNPEHGTEAYDAKRMLRMTTAVESLALAFTFTGQEQYAARAATLLRVWFLDPATRMTPHLTWAQANPGHNEVTGTGVINSVSLVQMPDAITLLSASRSLPLQDLRGLKAWFGEYLDWLLTSQKGKLEAAASNNHGVWYDAQVATYAVFVGRLEVARRIAEAAKTRRVTPQIEPDGRQPLELRRTRSLHYTLFNLRAFFALARAGKRVGVDLWGYSTPDGRSIRKALDYLAQYAAPDKKWPARELNGYTLDDFYPVMLLGAVAFQDPALLQKARQIGGTGQQASALRLLLNE